MRLPCEVIQLKHELTILLDIINKPNWSEQGCGLFNSRHVPTGVKWLRFHMTIDNINEADRDTILALAKNLKEHDFRFHQDRSDSTSALYQLVNNLGNNRDDAFNQLAIFRNQGNTQQHIAVNHII